MNIHDDEVVVKSNRLLLCQLYIICLWMILEKDIQEFHKYIYGMLMFDYKHMQEISLFYY